MGEPIIIFETPEQEAQGLMADAARKITTLLAQSIANIGVPVGMGMAPPVPMCAAAAERIVNIFGGAILAACERDRFKRRVERLEAGAPAEDVCQLVVAARLALEDDLDGHTAANLREATERFAARVCWDDEGGELATEAHATPCTCGNAPAN
jgi:hypothetical protein